MLAKKYLSPSRITSKGKKLPCLSVWTACKSGGEIFYKGIKWNIQTGTAVSFWLPSGTLRSLIVGPLTKVESSLSVADVHSFGGDWLLDKISFAFLESNLMEMIAIPFSPYGGYDCLGFLF